MWAVSFPCWSGCSRLASRSRSGCTSSRPASRPRGRRTPQASQPASQPRRPASPAYDTARATLARLPVKGWDRNTDFRRYRFGEAWSDDVNVEFGHNGCNTRDDILRRDLAELVVRPAPATRRAGCCTTRTPARPSRSPAARQPLMPCRSTIWCRCRTPGTRARATGTTSVSRDFANDPRNLLAVGAKANFDKAFRDATAGCRPTRRSAVSSSPAGRGEGGLRAVAVRRTRSGR